MDFSDEQNAYAQRFLEVVGTIGCRELLDVLKGSEEERGSLIGRLRRQEGAVWLAELLIDIEADPNDITRLRVIDALRRSLEAF